MTNFGLVKEKYTQEHNLHQPKIPGYPYKMLIVGDSSSGKMNALLNLINHQTKLIKSFCMSKIYLNQNISIQ